jgi:hypothetical protein
MILEIRFFPKNRISWVLVFTKHRHEIIRYYNETKFSEANPCSCYGLRNPIFPKNFLGIGFLGYQGLRNPMILEIRFFPKNRISWVLVFTKHRHEIIRYYNETKFSEANPCSCYGLRNPIFPKNFLGIGFLGYQGLRNPMILEIRFFQKFVVGALAPKSIKTLQHLSKFIASALAPKCLAFVVGALAPKSIKKSL